MSNDAKNQRLLEDLRVLKALRDESTIFDFVSGDGDPADEFTLIFKGKGIRRDRNSENGYSEVDEHKCEIRMGHGYPERAPDLRWLTPAYHPNITYSGFISLKDLGLPWDKAVSLDVVCERLWDAARMAHYDLSRASNYNAKSWLESEAKIDLPVDPRPLRDGPSEQINAGGNVVRYRRKDDKSLSLPVAEPVAGPDVFFIDEEKVQPIVFESPVRNINQRNAQVRDLERGNLNASYGGGDDEITFIE